MTAGLKSGNIEAATEAKAGLEGRQRAEAKQRKEDNTKWENRREMTIKTYFLYFFYHRIF